ncbi:MAG: S41 family peptidase [Novosphingobium sp.]|jgi:carboxyl-terminal processing protease|nr:S41 family peptidase [Novosphingobium sp.]MBP6556160.1 S41 family peptidase [Novosphingobium sp.]
MKLASLLRATALVSAVALIPATTAGLAAVDGRASAQFERLATVYQLVKIRYVEKVSDEKLEEGAIDGMLASLDPHSSYVSGASMQRLNTMIDGNYSGLGLSVGMEDGAVKVIAPMKGSPAEAAGVKSGDYITHLDGKLIYGGELDDAVAQMRGEAGTKIRLTLFRAGRNEPFDVTVTRGVIRLEPVTWELKDGVGVISVNEFSNEVGVDVAKGIEDLRKQSGGKLMGIVLDLRQNPGGALEEAVALSDIFLTKGDIVSQRGRNAREDEYFKAESMIPGDLAKGLPVIVLIDSGSASASEIVAGALQDQRRAVVMGERSFGKGSVQSLFFLDNSRTSAVKITTARYYTPLGRSVQEGGILPDIMVPQLSDPDARRRAELTVRESDLRRHLVNEAAIDDKKLEADRQADPRFKLSAEELKAKGIKDYQLYYAIQTLRRTAPPALAKKR